MAGVETPFAEWKRIEVLAGVLGPTMLPGPVRWVRLIRASGASEFRTATPRCSGVSFRQANPLAFVRDRSPHMLEVNQTLASPVPDERERIGLPE